jgi:hypothetical protein
LILYSVPRGSIIFTAPDNIMAADRIMRHALTKSQRNTEYSLLFFTESQFYQAEYGIVEHVHVIGVYAL